MKTSWLAGLACIALAACENGLLHQPAPAEPAQVAISYSLQGGESDAFDKANRIGLRFVAGDDVRLQEDLAFSPAAETHVPIRVPLRDLSESFTLDFELRRDAAALFRGSAPVTLGSLRPVTVNLTLTPVVARVLCAGPLIQFSSYGDATDVSGAALFATDDTIFNQALGWSRTGNAISITTTGARTARLVAVQDGDAQVQCSAGQATDTRSIRVLAVVQSIGVTPPTATVPVGSSQAFAATLRDGRGNTITGRPVAWTSSNPAAATVNASGTVTGVAPGTARIDASSGGVTGSANVTVTAPAPTVTTQAAVVTRLSANLAGTVNPNGQPTQAWFELGTSANLAGATTTQLQQVGSGSAAVSYSQTVSNLAPSTTYFFRARASNLGGTASGSIESFRTPDPGPPIATTGPGAFAFDPFTESNVVFQGTVIPMGGATRVLFQYGTSPDSLFASSPATSVGAGWDPVPVLLRAQAPQTDIYFRIVASNQFGTAVGAIGFIQGPVVGRPTGPIVDRARE